MSIREAVKACDSGVGSLPSRKWFGLAIQALVLLTDQEKLYPSCELAKRLSVEPTGLRRAMAALVKADILETREGRDGGYRLRIQPERLTLAEVYRALRMEESVCLGIRESASAETLGCGLRETFNEIAEELELTVLEVLGRRTIAELVQKSDIH